LILRQICIVRVLHDSFTLDCLNGAVAREWESVRLSKMATVWRHLVWM
jgi:hypothetical protein